MMLFVKSLRNAFLPWLNEDTHLYYYFIGLTFIFKISVHLEVIYLSVGMGKVGSIHMYILHRSYWANRYMKNAALASVFYTAIAEDNQVCLGLL